MRDHLPNLASVMAPLTRLTGSSVEWTWGEVEQRSFDAIKGLVPQCLKPLDHTKIDSGEHKLCVFTDASISGAGAHLNLGPTCKASLPFPFWSGKFNPAQVAYDTTNQEILSIVCATKEFEQHLVG